MISSLETKGMEFMGNTTREESLKDFLVASPDNYEAFQVCWQTETCLDAPFLKICHAYQLKAINWL